MTVGGGHAAHRWKCCQCRRRINLADRFLHPDLHRAADALDWRRRVFGGITAGGIRAFTHANLLRLISAVLRTGGDAPDTMPVAGWFAVVRASADQASLRLCTGVGTAPALSSRDCTWCAASLPSCVVGVRFPSPAPFLGAREIPHATALDIGRTVEIQTEPSGAINAARPLTTPN